MSANEASLTPNDSAGRPADGTTPLVTVQNLIKHFPVTRGLVLQRQVGLVRAVDGISFNIQRGETLGLVGESGCGKTTAGRTLLGLYPATSGEVLIDGHDLRHARGAELMTLRRKAQIIFQDPSPRSTRAGRSTPSSPSLCASTTCCRPKKSVWNGSRNCSGW